MLLTLLTLTHVVISLAGILAGFVILFGLLTASRYDRWTAIFLVTTIASSATGFLFPVQHFLPSHAVGIISLVVLALATYARYGRRLNGAWRKVYAIGAAIVKTPGPRRRRRSLHVFQFGGTGGRNRQGRNDALNPPFSSDFQTTKW